MVNATESVPAPRSEVRRAGHAGGAYDADIAACRDMLLNGVELNYISHITSGIFDFAFDVSGDRPAGIELSGVFDRAGRQLSLTVAQLDAACEPLDSGPLIRVVLQGEAGALFQFLKLAGQSFFGLTLDGSQEAVAGADHQMAELTESAARRVGAASLNWGGFKVREASGELWQAYRVGPSGASATSAYMTEAGRPVSDSLAHMCRDSLDPDSLHYVGVYHDGQPPWSVDIFNDPILAPFFQRVTPEFRRGGYENLLRQIKLQSRRLAQLLDVVRSERLVRLILDVARGGIYVMPLTGNGYLVGATLIQSQVEAVDHQFRALHERIESLLG